MTSRIVIDTNVLLRLLLGDHPVQSPAVSRWFERQAQRRDRELVVLQMVITEAVRVLRLPPYLRSHSHIITIIDAILGLPVTIDGRDQVVLALDLYRSSSARDWEDCLIAASALTDREDALATYDRKLARLPGLNIIAP